MIQIVLVVCVYAFFMKLIETKNNELYDGFDMGTTSANDYSFWMDIGEQMTNEFV